MNGQEKFNLIKISTEVLDKLKSRGFHMSTLSTYDFSIVYTTSPQNKKQVILIESSYHREGTLYLACGDKIAFFTLDDQKRFKLWLLMLYFLDDIFIRFGTKLYRQIVEIQWVQIALLLFLICFILL